MRSRLIVIRLYWIFAAKIAQCWYSQPITGRLQCTGSLQ